MAVGFAIFVSAAVLIVAGFYALVLTLAFATHNAVRPEREYVLIPEPFEAGITGVLYAVSHVAIGVPAQKVSAAVESAIGEGSALAFVALTVLGFWGELALMGLLIGVRHDLTVSQTATITVSTWLYSLLVAALLTIVLWFTGVAWLNGANF